MLRKGTYVLFLRFPQGAAAEVGSLGRVELPPGDYCYVGSARGGLDQRVGRHLSREKRIRWHIDRLTMICDDMSAMETEDPEITECMLAHAMLDIGNTPAVRGFGCSDCSCGTHLFRIDRGRTESALAGMGLVPFRECQTPADRKHGR